MSKNLVIELKKPYLFEGEEYANIDLSGMENLTMQDAIEAQKNVVGTGEDSVILYAPEASQAFIDEIAAMAAKQPVEFFNGMPIGLSDKVRTAVQGVFSADGNKAKDRVVTLDKPYTYDGKAVSVIDLSGVRRCILFHRHSMTVCRLSPGDISRLHVRKHCILMYYTFSTALKAHI